MPNVLNLCQLQRADILLKEIAPNAELISRLIGIGQRLHVKMHTGVRSSDYAKHLGFDPSKVSHVALAMGNSQIMEFDEGSGITEIAKFKGEGVVYDKPGKPVNRAGNSYIVIRCLNSELAERASRKAISIQTHSATLASASYGLRKLMGTSIFHLRGAKVDETKINRVMGKLRGENQGIMGMRRANMFCSEFVLYCYLWAAHDMGQASSNGGDIDVSWVAGIDRARISPGELGVRLLTYGANNFEAVGLYRG